MHFKRFKHEQENSVVKSILANVVFALFVPRSLSLIVTKVMCVQCYSKLYDTSNTPCTQAQTATYLGILAQNLTANDELMLSSHLKIMKWGHYRS